MDEKSVISYLQLNVLSYRNYGNSLTSLHIIKSVLNEYFLRRLNNFLYVNVCTIRLDFFALSCPWQCIDDDLYCELQHVMLYTSQIWLYLLRGVD